MVVGLTFGWLGLWVRLQKLWWEWDGVGDGGLGGRLGGYIYSFGT